MKILIADDHAVVRKGLRQILADMPELTEADEACTGQDVLNKVQASHYDMVLLDISMPGMNGIEILKQLKTDYPHLKILVLSVHPEDQYAVRALKTGASGYLTKESSPQELLAAIHKISRGEKYVSSSLAARMAWELEKEFKTSRHETLSDREFEVLRMLASGQSVTEVAELLSLSVKTVSTYRSRILDKMGMKNNAQLTHYAIRNNLID